MSAHPTLRVKFCHPAFALPLLRHYSAICVGRVIWFKEARSRVNEALLRHELIHQEQMDRHGLVSFYLIYLFDYFRNLIRFQNHRRAYLEIPFEVEARRGEADAGVLARNSARLPRDLA